MKEIITYEAFDGTIFEDEYECVAYERLKQSEGFSGQIHFFNIRKRPLPISCDQDGVYYVIVDTTEAAEWWNDLCAKEGLEQPFKKKVCKPGFYWYETCDDTWKCLQEEMEKLQMMADEFQQFVE